MSKIWDQAGYKWRTYSSPKPRKMHGPVGEKRQAPWNETEHDSLQQRACTGCGFHGCQRPSL